MQHGRLGNAYSVLVNNPERKILLGTRRRRREDIKMDLKQDGRGSDWISDKRWAVMNKVMNFGFHTTQSMLTAYSTSTFQERRCSMHRATVSSCFIQLLSTPSPWRREKRENSLHRPARDYRCCYKLQKTQEGGNFLKPQFLEVSK